MNANMGPPPPPSHFPPGNGPDGPPIILNHPPPQQPIDPMRLSDQMGRLNLNADRFHPGSSPSANSPSQYEGYTFTKADAIPGQKPSWNRVDRTQMDLTQSALQKMVEKRSKKTSASQQCQKLSPAKRDIVDQLIDDLRRVDPRAQWQCAYVKVAEKIVRGKGSRRDHVEAVSMDVIIARKTSPFPKRSLSDTVNLKSPPKDRERPAAFGGPFPGEDIRPINRGMEGNGPFPRQNGPAGPPGPPGQLHPPMNGQPPPPPFHQPPHPMPQGQGMGGPGGPMLQGPGGPGPRPQMPPGGMHSPPGMQGPPQGVNNDPGFVTLNEPKASPPGPRQGPMGPGFSPPPGNHFQKPNHPNMKMNGHIPKAPHVPHHHEPEWGPESSVEDDESMMFDISDEGFATDDTDYEIHDTLMPGRGSLHRQHSTKGRREPVYRPHHRPQPGKYPLDRRYNQKRYPAGYVDVMPSRSCGKRMGRTHSNEMAVHGSRGIPKIIHGLDIPFEDEFMHDRLRGGRARNDIRTRMLDEREARLDHREDILDYQAHMHQNRMLDGRFEDPRYLGRQTPLREPCYHEARYLP